MKNRTIIITSKRTQGLGPLLFGAPTEGVEYSIIFFGDGVYSLIKDSEEYENLRRKIPTSADLFACKEDVDCRGLAMRIPESVRSLQYDEIAGLIMDDGSKVMNYG